MKRCFLFFLNLLFFSFFAEGKFISPFDYGLNYAKDGKDVYYVLLRTHEAAIAQGCNVSYKGIKKLELEIPSDARSISLPQKVDFHGVRIIVKNNAKSLFLFSLSQETKAVAIDKNDLSYLSFDKVKELDKGCYLLLIQDNNPWVEKRGGYDYGAYRKDVVVVKNGKGMNNVVYTYDTKWSMPQVTYVKVNNQVKKYYDLEFERTVDSRCMTWLFKIENQFNIHLNNITIQTPKSDLYGDCAIQIRDCAKVTLKDVIINGTYSAKNKYGYGISMNNVFDSQFIRLKGIGEWGVFGNYNINKAYLVDCDINRFDIHCYGKDVRCKNTIFREWYNQVSSFYGTLSFERCTFIHFVPILFEPSFSAYTPFTIKIKNCNYEVDKRRPYLIDAGYPSVTTNASREEIISVNWPNIEIDGLKVNLPGGLKDWYLFWVNGKDAPVISGFSSVRIRKLTVNADAPMTLVNLSNKLITTDEDLHLTISSSSVMMINNGDENRAH